MTQFTESVLNSATSTLEIDTLVDSFAITDAANSCESKATCFATSYFLIRITPNRSKLLFIFDTSANSANTNLRKYIPKYVIVVNMK